MPEDKFLKMKEGVKAYFQIYLNSNRSGDPPSFEGVDEFTRAAKRLFGDRGNKFDLGDAIGFGSACFNGVSYIKELLNPYMEGRDWASSGNIHLAIDEYFDDMPMYF